MMKSEKPQASGPAPKVSPKDSRLVRLHIVTTRLTEILSAEISLLKTRRPREIEQFQEEKSGLIRHYMRETAALKPVINAPNAPAASDLQIIHNATRAFTDALQTHELILATKKQVTEGMLQAIGQEVARRNKPLESYRSTGVMGPAMPTFAAARPTTLTLDQRV
jgi:hypothetical protein